MKWEITLAADTLVALSVAHGFVLRSRGIATGATDSSMDEYKKSVAGDMRMMMLRVTPIAGYQSNSTSHD